MFFYLILSSLLNTGTLVHHSMDMTPYLSMPLIIDTINNTVVPLIIEHTKWNSLELIYYR